MLALAPMVMAAPLVTVSLGDPADVTNGDINAALALVDDGGTIQLIQAGDYDPVVYTGNNDISATIEGTVPGVRIASTSPVPAVRVSSTSATAAVALNIASVDVWTSASGTTTHAVEVTQTTYPLALSFANLAIENASTADPGRGNAVHIFSAAQPVTAGALNINFNTCDVSTTGSGQSLVRMNVEPTTMTQVHIAAVDSTFISNGVGNNNHVIVQPANSGKVYIDNSFSFDGCTLQAVNGTTSNGFFFRTNQPSWNNSYSFVDSSISIRGGGSNAHGIWIEATANNELNTGHTLFIDRCTFDSTGGGVTNTQGRGVRFNINNDVNLADLSNTMEIYNSVVVVPGQGLNGAGFATSNQSNALSVSGSVVLTAHHNTLVAKTTLKGHSGIWSNSSRAADVRNNIFYNFGGQSSHYDTKGGTGVLANQQGAPLNHSGNVVAGVDTDSDLAPTLADVANITLPEVQVFTDIDANDFTLLLNSPALGGLANTTDVGVAVDILGNARPVDTPDAGAYESLLVPVELGSFTME